MKPMTAETDLLPLPPRVGVDKHLPTGVVIYGYTHDMMRDYARANVAHATAPLQAGIEALREEIGRLLDSREREGDRLDWLLARLPGDVIRDLVGEMSCTSDVGEWRDRIDKAARFKPPNP
jgi:hypothetical protein